MKKQTLWRVRYETQTYIPVRESVELLAADTLDDALRLARALPGSRKVQGVESYGWCWA
jgi:hypothetical protein